MLVDRSRGACLGLSPRGARGVWMLVLEGVGVADEVVGVR